MHIKPQIRSSNLSKSSQSSINSSQLQEGQRNSSETMKQQLLLPTGFQDQTMMNKPIKEQQYYNGPQQLYQAQAKPIEYSNNHPAIQNYNLQKQQTYDKQQNQVQQVVSCESTILQQFSTPIQKLEETLIQSEILICYPTLGSKGQSIGKQFQEDKDNIKHQKSDSFKSLNSVDCSIIIPNSKVSDIDIHSNTHNMIIIEENLDQFEIKPMDEKFNKEKLINKQLVNSNLLIIQNIKKNIPEYQYQERLCQQHNKQIDKICTEKECKDSKELLLCQDCARSHKGHNQYDIPEALFIILENQKILEGDEYFINVLKQKTFQQFKVINSNINLQLQEIEAKLQQGFDACQKQLEEKKISYQQAFFELSSGGLSKMVEQVNYVIEQELFQEIHLNQNELLYKQLAQNLEEVKLSMKKFDQLVQQQVKEPIKIKLNNIQIQIEDQKIKNLNDLYYQIKIEALKLKLTTILNQELVLIQDQKAIKLKGNQQKVDLQQQSQIQIVSYTVV